MVTTAGIQTEDSLTQTKRITVFVRDTDKNTWSKKHKENCFAVEPTSKCAPTIKRSTLSEVTHFYKVQNEKNSLLGIDTDVTNLSRRGCGLGELPSVQKH